MIDHIIIANKINAGGRQHHLTLDIDPGIPQFVITDEYRLSQVITNLLSMVFYYS